MIWSLFFLVFVASSATTAVIRRLASSARLIDRPNLRSSHSIPIPRGGGLSIFCTTTIGLSWLGFNNLVDQQLILGIVGGGIAIAVIGFLDDMDSLSVKVRIAVHTAAAVWAMYVLGGLPLMEIGERIVDLGWFGNILGALAIIWILNLFNFMDGIDGIAASEAIFVTLAGAVLVPLTATSHSVSVVALLLAAACLGFLIWNWPPAKIFMGDVGSGYLGYVIAVLAISAAHDNPVALFVWLTLGGVFFVDATVTLVRRLARGERVYEAHRAHAYQWLSRRWKSHLRVTLLFWVINLFWLLPMAWCCVLFPDKAWWICLIALFPIAVGVYGAGAGRAETPIPQAG